MAEPIGFDFIKPEGWNQQKESVFQDWYRSFARPAGFSLNPDDPQGRYNYRGFFDSGMATGPDPTDIDALTGKPRTHFPDEYKMPGHPNLLWAGNNMGQLRQPEGEQGVSMLLNLFRALSQR